MRSQCEKCKTWVAWSADGVTYESNSGAHIGELHDAARCAQCIRLTAAGFTHERKQQPKPPVFTLNMVEVHEACVMYVMRKHLPELMDKPVNAQTSIRINVEPRTGRVIEEDFQVTVSDIEETI